ncbi:protein ANTHESIS POMOTING FACTOR 1 isoform X1 [Cucurbita moschata]|uniref:Protein ANTHESIS POMOTING FACTOR 1 isoform X1 n=2 Tax=Cucurbita moschata TaxID=3662 RepID=A0A6J1FAR4_CUCMO|nr:protein ANTHESIS POMOTING FACTOR 1 isoform X1 [Cucurbita moschata]
MALTELDDGTVRSMAIGAVFSDFVGKINSLDFHRKDDLLVTASEDDSVRLYDIANARLLKTTFHKKHGADRICFTHHPSSVICSSRYNLDTTGESLRYLSMYDNRCLRYFKGHKERVVSLCMSPINDSFMSGSLDHSVRIWDLRVNACQGILRLRGRPTVAYDQQGLVFAVAMEGGAIKLFDSRSYDKGPFDTFLVGGDMAEVFDIKFSNDGKSMLLTTTNNNIYVLDAYGGEKQCGFSLEPSPNTTIEATFTPDGQYVVSGSGDGTLHAWNINKRTEVASWNSHIGVASCLKWAPRRVMFVAASTVLTFWIPNTSKSTGESVGEARHLDLAGSFLHNALSISFTLLAASCNVMNQKPILFKSIYLCNETGLISSLELKNIAFMSIVLYDKFIVFMCIVLSTIFLLLFSLAF